MPDLFFFKILTDFSNSHFVKKYVKMKVNDKYIFHTLTFFQNEQAHVVRIVFRISTKQIYQSISICAELKDEILKNVAY